MAQGHAIIVNLSSWIPFIFQFNPAEVSSKKKINYAKAPNIGGSYKRRYFSGFDTKEIELKLKCIDKISPIGVSDDVAFFEALREPDGGPFHVANSFFGDENFPPPQVLFQFGQGFVPLVWDVLEVEIKTYNFFDDRVRGIIGIPKQLDVELKLALDEGNVLHKANQIAKKAEAYYAGLDSIAREVRHNAGSSHKVYTGTGRREASGIALNKVQQKIQG